MEQQLQKFMIQQFQPSGVSFLESGHENISEYLEPYFMPISGVSVPILDKPIYAPIPSRSVNIINEKSVRKEFGNEKKKLDQYWAFWAAYIAANGMEAYENISEKDRFKFRLEQKAKASEWMVEDFKRTKSLMAPHWYRLTNRDMEDMATSLMTNADESKEGLDCMVMMWNYYLYHGVDCMNSRIIENPSNDLFWVQPSKKIFYKLSTIIKMNKVENENSVENVPDVVGSVWGVFVNEKVGSMDHKKRNYSYELRRITRDERFEIEKNMVCLSYVDKPLMAVSKYTLKELIEMAELFGVRPSMKPVLNLESLVSDAEINLGVIRKKTEVKKEMEEKWKKGDWYENLEIYLSDLF